MSYKDLGRRKVVSAPDQTGLNTGNWTAVFDHATIGGNVPFFECYHMTVINVPVLPSLMVYKNTDVYSTALLVGNAEWDPQQPMPLTPTDDVYLCWSAAATGTPPTCWMWFRYDPAINPPGT